MSNLGISPAADLKSSEAEKEIEKSPESATLPMLVTENYPIIEKTPDMVREYTTVREWPVRIVDEKGIFVLKLKFIDFYLTKE